jgi:hypothetical protein
MSFWEMLAKPIVTRLKEPTVTTFKRKQKNKKGNGG